MEKSKKLLWVRSNNVRLHLKYLCIENPYIVTNNTRDYLRELEIELVNNIEDAPTCWKVNGNGHLETKH